jgi:mono/diheme cytochrome c family protein
MHGRKGWLAALAIFASLLAGCAEEEAPLPAAADAGDDVSVIATSPDAGPPPPSGPMLCSQARAQSLPSRLIAIGAGGDAGAPDASQALATGPTWLISDLYSQFNSICGRCHGSAQGMGGFQVRTQNDFVATDWSTIILHVTSDGMKAGDLNSDPMPPFNEPPLGMPYSQRTPTDPVKQFAELVLQWLTLKMPASFQYTLPGTMVAAGEESTIPIPNASVGNPMTNIGNCIPSQALLYTSQSKMDALDAMFAAAKAQPVGPGVSAQQVIGLPLHLSETDLVTFDSVTLARMGVIAYAPGYPLWSDNAGKLRYIRVPKGTSVVFDKATQSFTIPPNTRFYKTFMKQIVDTDGSLRYRKIETRLILSRPGSTPAGNGIETPAALFGTYKWNDDESDAVLVTTPLNSGAPFGDTVVQYDTNEPLAADLLQGQPLDPEATLLEYGAARHYAIPSSQRCVQCHEGSETKSFVLGFLPLQINRRPTGQGGTIEATGPDELTQMQRFIDYGLITGVTSPSDVLPLERVEGSRSPRNDYELVAQGYMLGNCAHCHNPGGFPSQQNPVLVDILNFYPSPAGGIFQFPLERTSPRIFRGVSGQVPLPYITPSLMDLPRNGTPDVFSKAGLNHDGSDAVELAWYAPWRSLIYRNVDNPFAYTDDSALFPHMPMNTPGYDDRARQILSDWMVSIPAIRKDPEIPEYAFLDSTGATRFGAAVDGNTQPYVEVLPGDPRYPDAVSAAAQRLQILHSGVNPNVSLAQDATWISRYATPGRTEDILDPSVPNHPCNPVPLPIPPKTTTSLTQEPIPGHCHWVVTDTTQPPGAWSPRRPDWATVLVDQHPTAPSACLVGSAATTAQTEAATAVSLLQNITLTGASSYVKTPVPFGLWQNKPGCDFSKHPDVAPTARSFLSSSQPPLWMVQSPPSPDAPVYMSTPGEAVFKMICINCHGPLADATGRLAQNLATMTGGLDLVADFRDGLFGPVSSPDSNLNPVFSVLPADASSSWTGVSNDDRAARYMSWMALGGTEVSIPVGLLTIVGATPVLDKRRPLAPTITSANMLSTAKALCDQALGPSQGNDFTFFRNNILNYSTALIPSNGDAELWLRLCSLNNPPPIRVISAAGGQAQLPQAFDLSGAFTGTPNGFTYLVPNPKNFPAGSPIGNERGQTVKFTPGDPNNLWPWCLYDPQNKTAGQGYPICPQAALTVDNAFNNSDPNQALTWSVRGAINAGLGVFLYVQSLEKMSAPPVDYDACEQLQ